ncbi:MAG TPA: hypothetical protein VGE72_26700 [Azospirillum sp.]
MPARPPVEPMAPAGDEPARVPPAAPGPPQLGDGFSPPPDDPGQPLADPAEPPDAPWGKSDF